MKQKISNDASELIGNTPLVRLSKLGSGLNGTVIAKLESFNPLSCVKERIALYMINDAEKKGKLKKGSVIVEPTSGNTGIGLAFISAIRDYKLILTMPDSVSAERTKIMRALGAEIVLTPGKKGMKGAIEKAEQIASSKNAFMPGQFENPANVQAHRETTATEIWNDTGGGVDILVAGVGTGGTITGCGEVLKKHKPSVKIVAVEPSESAVLSGMEPCSHPIQGIGAGFVPKIFNREIIDEIVTVSGDDAKKAARALAKKEGIFAGISSGAAVHAALKIASRKESKGKMIVAILPDTGERYLSTELFED